MEEAIADLTEIADGFRTLVKDQERRIAYLEKYAKLRRPSVVEAFGDVFGGALRSVAGG